MEQIIKKLENKVVYIDKSNFEEARKLIEAKGFEVNDFFAVSSRKKDNYLFLDYGDEKFGISVKMECDEEIAFEEFKTIMK